MRVFLWEEYCRDLVFIPIGTFVIISLELTYTFTEHYNQVKIEAKALIFTKKR